MYEGRDNTNPRSWKIGVPFFPICLQEPTKCFAFASEVLLESTRPCSEIKGIQHPREINTLLCPAYLCPQISWLSSTAQGIPRELNRRYKEVKPWRGRLKPKQLQRRRHQWIPLTMASSEILYRTVQWDNRQTKNRGIVHCHASFLRSNMMYIGIFIGRLWRC